MLPARLDYYWELVCWLEDIALATLQTEKEREGELPAGQSGAIIQLGLCALSCGLLSGFWSWSNLRLHCSFGYGRITWRVCMLFHRECRMIIS